MMRTPWDLYFMKLARVAAERSTCDRRQVGAVLVNLHRRVIATGYNGSMPGQPHCDDAGHDMEDGHCVRTIHAEINALASAAFQGSATNGASLYVNTPPCWQCFKALASAGIIEVVYEGDYRMDPRFDSYSGLVRIRPLLEM